MASGTLLRGPLRASPRSTLRAVRHARVSKGMPNLNRVQQERSAGEDRRLHGLEKLMVYGRKNYTVNDSWV